MIAFVRGKVPLPAGEPKFATLHYDGMNTASQSDVRHHTQKLKGQMRELIDHLRADVEKISEPKARAMFETSAEVMIGLVKAFDDYEQKAEAAWKESES